MSYFILILFGLIISESTPEKGKDCVDLSVKEIPMPDWEHEEDRTAITIIIQNKGKADASSFKVTVEDYDPTADYYKEMGDKELAEDMMFQEEYGDGGEGGDFDWELEVEVDGLKAGKTKEVVLYLPEHWIYDPNCEMKIVIDPDKSTKDCNWENNTEYYYAWG